MARNSKLLEKIENIIKGADEETSKEVKCIAKNKRIEKMQEKSKIE